MGIHLRGKIQAKEIVCRLLPRIQAVPAPHVPKGHFAFYVGESRRRIGLDHQMGGLTIPCHEDTFITLTSQLNCF
ncbi:hypothetical protein AAC387_Pa01g1017 [Persea americana]